MSNILVQMRLKCIPVLILDLFLVQSHSDGESHRSNMEREDTRSSPSPPSTPYICSPISTASSVASTGKNVCASCGLEILDRYLLKVRVRALLVMKRLKPHEHRIYVFANVKQIWKIPLTCFSFYNFTNMFDVFSQSYIHVDFIIFLKY